MPNDNRIVSDVDEFIDTFVLPQHDQQTMREAMIEQEQMLREQQQRIREQARFMSNQWSIASTGVEPTTDFTPISPARREPTQRFGDMVEITRPDTGTLHIDLRNTSDEEVAQFISGLDEDEVIDYLLESGMNPPRISRIMDIIRGIAPADPMAGKIKRYLRGENVEGIDEKVVEDYYQKEKKRRFLIRDERQGLHKPKSDGKKTTSSVKLDDILPKE